jgi:hypothetical protein
MWDKLYVAAPDGTAWPLDLDTAEAKLRERFPEAVTSRQTARASGQDYLSFDVPIEGMMRHGIYVEGGNLTLSDGAPADWAETVSWFLSLLPAGTPAVALTEHNQQLTPVAPGAPPERIRDLFEGLIAAS